LIKLLRRFFSSTKPLSKKYILCTVVGIVVVFLVFLIITLPYVIVLMGPEIESEKIIYNPVIKSDYIGWKTVPFQLNKCFKIPEMWTLKEDSDHLIIEDERGIVIANGVVLKSPFDERDCESFFQSVVPFDIEKRESSALTHEFIRTASAYYEVSFFGTSNEFLTYYQLCLFMPESEGVFLFEIEENNCNERLTQIEAIAFSFHTRK